MFTHHKLKVYVKAVQFAGNAGKLARTWGKRHAIADQLHRASESVILNIAEGARLVSSVGKVRSLDYSIGSTLECAACLDIAGIKEIMAASEAFDEKSRLREIMRMLAGLRIAWMQPSLREESLEDQEGQWPAESCFHHEVLDVYQVGLEFIRWFVALPQGRDLADRLFREVDKAATSVVLNVAEGNGRYSELDHRRFLDMAAASAVKAAAYLDLCREDAAAPLGVSPGQLLLGRITAMLSKF